jgi:hypothetical protein
MAKPARIRLAGTIAATMLCAAAATEAAARNPPQDGTIVLNQQLQLGDVFAGQTLNVVDSGDQVTVQGSALGNSASGAVYNGSIIIQSDQTMQGDAVATTDITLSGDTDGVVNATTQAGGNYLAASAYGANLTLDATQTTDNGLISATTEVGDSSARLHAGAAVGASAISNTVAVYGQTSVVSGTINQSSSALVRSFGRIESQYIPAEASVTSQAIVNAIAVNSDNTSGQDLSIAQRSFGSFIESEASANAGNAWDLAALVEVMAPLAAVLCPGGAAALLRGHQPQLLLQGGRAGCLRILRGLAGCQRALQGGKAGKEGRQRRAAAAAGKERQHRAQEARSLWGEPAARGIERQHHARHCHARRQVPGAGHGRAHQARCQRQLQRRSPAIVQEPEQDAHGVGVRGGHVLQLARATAQALPRREAQGLVEDQVRERAAHVQARCLEALAESDVYSRQIASKQHWGLSTYLVCAANSPHLI